MSTADLFAEAVDTAYRLFYAGAAWFALMAVVVGIVVAAVVVVVSAVIRTGWRTLRVLWARARGCALAGAPHSPSCDSRDAGDAPEPPQRRTRPSWAHEQPIEPTERYEEAA